MVFGAVQTNGISRRIMMSKTTRRLGRGLDSLISNLLTEGSPATTQDANAGQASPAERSVDPSTGDLAMILIDDLNPNPLQPRSSIKDEDVASLAQSISSSGLLQPIAVRRVEGRFEIIAGERRWRAAKSAGMDRVPVIIHEANDEKTIELALIENIQREDLNAIDRAKAYRRFCDQFNLKAEEVARRLAEDRTTVTNYLRLLDLPEEIRKNVASGQIAMGHARCLAGISDVVRQRELANRVVKDQISVRTLETMIRQDNARHGAVTDRAQKTSIQTPAHVRHMEKRFEEALKTKVVIREGRRKGSGRIMIDYYTLDDFERIATRLGLNLSDDVE